MKSALAREYVAPSQPNEPPNRPQLGMVVMLGAVMIGALVLSRRPDDVVAWWTVGIVTVASAFAGAVYHPMNKYWVKGLVAGAVTGVCALVATHYYVEMRFGMSDWISSAEFLIPAFLGGLPGIGLYIQLMRHEVVDDEAQGETGYRRGEAQPPLPAIAHHSPLAAIILGWWRRRKAMRRRSAISAGAAQKSLSTEALGWRRRLKAERVCPTCEREIIGGVVLCQQCGGLLNPRRWVLALGVVVLMLAAPWIYMWWIGSPFL
jgi:hypothetical protein